MFPFVRRGDIITTVQCVKVNWLNKCVSVLLEIEYLECSIFKQLELRLFSEGQFSCPSTTFQFHLKLFHAIHEENIIRYELKLLFVILCVLNLSIKT
jgi:hypothetical protein